MIRFMMCLVLSLCLPAIGRADTFAIVIKDHQFNPPQLAIPAGRKVQITVDNQDPTPEEFESFDLDREQVVEGNKKIVIFIGPLKPGKYNYWADFHQDSKGTIVAQ